MRDTIPEWEVGLLWLELTNRCQLRCSHCYAESGPDGSRGAMSRLAWESVIDQAAKANFRRVTFIGGEPTLNRDLPALVEYALHRGLCVSIFSNLIQVSQEIWRLAADPRVRLKTSYYSSSAEEHDAITGIDGSHARTSAAIQEAFSRGISIQVALIEVRDGQQADGVRRELGRLGMTVSGPYPTRPVGRAANLPPRPAPPALCGRCAFRTLAVSCDGLAFPCVFARASPVGDVLREPLAEIIASQRMQDARALARGSSADPTVSRCAP